MSFFSWVLIHYGLCGFLEIIFRVFVVQTISLFFVFAWFFFSQDCLYFVLPLLGAWFSFSLILAHSFVCATVLFALSCLLPGNFLAHEGTVFFACLHLCGVRMVLFFPCGSTGAAFFCSSMSSICHS